MVALIVRQNVFLVTLTWEPSMADHTLLTLVETPLDEVRLPRRSWLYSREWSVGIALPDSLLAWGLAKKSQHKDPLYFHWAPRPAPLGPNVDLSRLEFGLHGTMAKGKLQQSPGTCIAADVCIWPIPPNKSCRSLFFPWLKPGKTFAPFSIPYLCYLTNFQSDVR